MPHFSAIPFDNRAKFVGEVATVLREKFHKKGWKHMDVKWNNIGHYVKSDAIEVVVYDLGMVQTVEAADDDTWIDAAVANLLRTE